MDLIALPWMPCGHRDLDAREPILDLPRCRLHESFVSRDLCRHCLTRDPMGEPDPILPGSIRSGRSVAVVIPCHNYGRYLARCVESVLAQARRPDEVLIVDDASTDDTPEVAARFAPLGIGYLRVEHRNLTRTKRAGLAATRSEVLCFLDADDTLGPDYLAAGLPLFDADPAVGIVYSEAWYDGDDARGNPLPEAVDRDRIARENVMHAGSLVRREALLAADATDHGTDTTDHYEDWRTWRKVLALGYTAVRSPGRYNYYRRDDGMCAAQARRGDYFDTAGLGQEPLTICTPLAGRAALWPDYAAFLERQTWPHRQSRLILLDTSGDEDFGRMVRAWTATCDYADVRYVRDECPRPGLADQRRNTEAGLGVPAVLADVHLAMIRIYNRIARMVETDYVWVIEDDVIPPDDAARRLLHGFDRDTAAVSGAYPHRYGPGYVAWTRTGGGLLPLGRGLQAIRGCGFGCLMIRGEMLRSAVFGTRGPVGDCDVTFFDRLDPALGRKIHWGVLCAHRSPDYTVRRPCGCPE